MLALRFHSLYVCAFVKGIVHFRILVSIEGPWGYEPHALTSAPIRICDENEKKTKHWYKPGTIRNERWKKEGNKHTRDWEQNKNKTKNKTKRDKQAWCTSFEHESQISHLCWGPKQFVAFALLICLLFSFVVYLSVGLFVFMFFTFLFCSAFGSACMHLCPIRIRCILFLKTRWNAETRTRDK